MFDYAHSENTQAYLEHIMAEEKHKIKDFYVLFISDYNIGKKNYSLFFDRHIMDESIVYVEQDEGSINAPSYIVDGDEYAKNEELFYKIRLQSR